MTAHDIIAKLRANADQAEMRRSEFRPPVVRPWGVAPEARPRLVRRERSLAVMIGWVVMWATAGFMLGIAAFIFGL